jgi:enamine deaminase RidA (YjgF/YER057c/UK114 family)
MRMTRLRMNLLKITTTRTLAIAGLTLLVNTPAFAQSATFYGSPTGRIASGVILPVDRQVLWSSGATPGVVNQEAPADSPDRYGDTKAQARSTLQKLEADLKAQGASMKDVVYIRAYLVPDPKTNNRIDTQGWNAAYGEFFGNAENPTKPARSTVGVAQLVGATQLIEIELFAVMPKR